MYAVCRGHRVSKSACRTERSLSLHSINRDKQSSRWPQRMVSPTTLLGHSTSASAPFKWAAHGTLFMGDSACIHELAEQHTGVIACHTAAATTAPSARNRPPVLQATFRDLAEQQQHLDGAVHRKALAKRAAKQEEQHRLSRSRGAAEAAVVSMLLPDVSIMSQKLVKHQGVCDSNKPDDAVSGAAAADTAM